MKALCEHYSEQVAEFVAVCHALAKSKYVTGYGGNLAWRLEDDLFLITPTQMNKGDIRAADVVFIRKDGAVVEGTRRPTGETPMYVNFFRERPDIQSVLHCHPPYSNAFAITKGKNWLMRPLFPETITEVGPVPIVPYAEPLTQRLADNFLPFLQRYNAFLMENHGLVIMSRLDIRWTLMNVELLEMTALHVLQALQLGDIKEIARADVCAMDNVMRARNLPFMGATGVHNSLDNVYDWEGCRLATRSTEQAFGQARERYAELGVDVDQALAGAAAIPLSMHCWQADDVTGFETKTTAVAGSGFLATGHYPGRARTAEEARADYEQVLALVPGAHRLNLHACYAETGIAVVDRDVLSPEHFRVWMEWAAGRGLSLDFNPTYFAHPLAGDGYTLSHQDKSVREFWIRHGIASRRIAEAMARKQGTPCLLNHWIPDGEKDVPVDRWSPRERLTASLDAILAEGTGVDRSLCLDHVESKLFGIGSEAYVVGSAEFYSSYALSRGIGLCVDMGHYHPTETIHDKISALLSFHKRLLIHVSRPMRWDSDHVALFDDDVRAVMLEIARGNAWSRVALATDYFDPSVNRIAAYVIGLRAARKAILYAMLLPGARLQEMERSGDRAGRLALMDESKTLPFGAVWDRLCEQQNAPCDHAWMPTVRAYERDVLSAR